MSNKLAELLAPYEGEKGALIPILQKVQGEFGYLSDKAIHEIAHFMGTSESEIFGVATFYAQFRFTPRGKHVVKVCLGTSCYVRGATQIMEAMEQKLGIKSGDTTSDLEFSLESVACFGCCALSPIIVVDDTVYSKITAEKAKQIVSSYE